MDICIASADPSEDLDALTIGMVCVRNLQVFFLTTTLIFISITVFYSHQEVALTVDGAMVTLFGQITMTLE